MKLTLKELRNYNHKLFLYPPEDKRNHNQTTKTTFQNKFKLWHVRLNTYIWKATFCFHKQYLFGLLFSRNPKKTHTGQSKLQNFLLGLKRNVLKSSSCKIVFSRVCISLIKLSSMNVLYSM